MKVVLLPGMDGTGELFAPFTRLVPRDFELQVSTLPPRFPEGTFAIVAESFSGPVAIEFAATHPERVIALVLCNSFATAPLPRFVAWLPYIAPPRFAIRYFLTGSDAMVDEVQTAIAKVPKRVLRERIRAVTRVSCMDALRTIRRPILDLRGAGDRLIPARCARELAPFATKRVIRGPHLLLQLNPGDAWDAIASFLNTPAVPAADRS